MAILVLGGAGYIGSHAVKSLLKNNKEVIVVDNLSTGHREAVDYRAKFYKCDIANEESMNKVFLENDIQAVFHFAAYSLVQESMSNPLKYFQNNTSTIISLLKYLKRHKVKYLIFSSTAAVYGEPDNVPIREDAKQQPTSPYGESKLMMEKIIDSVSRSSDLNYVSLRYFNVAGASKNSNIGELHNPETHLIPIILKYVLNQRDELYVYGKDYNTKDGTCIRDYIHVEDLVEAHILALDYLLQGGESEIFNLGYNRGYSILEIIQAIEDVTGKSVDFIYKDRRPGDPSVLIANANKAMKVLDWKPINDDIKNIINDAWKWHSSHLRKGVE
jgi:UDP-glucose 4-epimerase